MATAIAFALALAVVVYASIRLAQFMSKLGRHIDRHLDDDASRQKPK